MIQGRPSSAAAVSSLLLLTALAAPRMAAEDGFEFWPGARYDASVPTMNDVLGHAPGERITSHAEIMLYLEALVGAVPDRIQLFEYARSWEGRKLVYAVVGRTVT